MRQLSHEEILEARRNLLFPAYVTYYPDDPLVLERAAMQYVYDDKGKEYLDAFGSVVTISVGHCHPEVVEAVRMQVGRAQHFTTLYAEHNLALAATMLAEVTPVMLTRSFWTNSGGEANDFAAHVAMRATKRTGLLALRHSFHGRTGTASALTFQKPWRNVPPYKSDVHSVPNPYTFRRPEGMTEENFLRWCLTETRQVINHAFGDNLAAIWIEPIQGNGGVITAPPWYYDELVEMVHEAGGLVIADEVQTGVGRTGRMWGCSYWHKRPDMMVMAKGLGNGYPVGCVVTTNEVAERFGTLTHFNTYGGAPVATLAVATVLDIVGRDETKQNIARQGGLIMGGLQTISERHPSIGEVRGQGLMIGVEIVNPAGKSPAKERTLRILRLCRDRGGLLLGTGGVDGNVIRIKPPYCITDENSAAIVDTLDQALTEVEAA